MFNLKQAMSKRNVCLVFLNVFLIVVVSAGSLFAATKKDPCARKGIVVKNLSMVNLWYMSNGGACTLWKHDHIFIIKPGDTIEIFSDLTCETMYCDENPTYKVYKSFDSDGNCRVRVLTQCTLSDM